jgi:transcriptional antiterminator RfaH
MRWHVAFIEGGKEQKSCAEIQELGFEAFVPMQRHRRWLRGHWTYPETALFPSYLFAKFDSSEPHWNEIRSAKGVLDVLCNQGKPLAVPAGMTEKLQRMQLLGLFDYTKAPNPFPPGTMVMLDDDGPFAEFIGKVINVRSGDRIKLLIKYLGRELKLNVSLARLSQV